MGSLSEFLVGAAAAVAGRQIYDSGPKVSSWIIRKAAHRLPRQEDRARREEEWLAHLAEEPGLAGLRHAFGAMAASLTMAWPFERRIISVVFYSQVWMVEVNAKSLSRQGHYIARSFAADSNERSYTMLEDADDLMKICTELRELRLEGGDLDLPRDEFWQTLRELPVAFFMLCLTYSMYPVTRLLSIRIWGSR